MIISMFKDDSIYSKEFMFFVGQARLFVIDTIFWGFYCRLKAQFKKNAHLQLFV